MDFEGWRGLCKYTKLGKDFASGCNRRERQEGGGLWPAFSLAGVSGWKVKLERQVHQKRGVFSEGFGFHDGQQRDVNVFGAKNYHGYF